MWLEWIQPISRLTIVFIVPSAGGEATGEQETKALKGLVARKRHTHAETEPYDQAGSPRVYNTDTKCH